MAAQRKVERRKLDLIFHQLTERIKKMTKAIVAFYADSKCKAGIYYNSDGYVEGTGKLVSQFLAKYPINDSMGALVGNYIIDKEFQAYELAQNDMFQWAEYTYSIFYNRETKAIEKVEVKYGSKEVELMFTGNVQEYIKWVEDIYQDN